MLIEVISCYYRRVNDPFWIIDFSVTSQLQDFSELKMSVVEQHLIITYLSQISNYYIFTIECEVFPNTLYQLMRIYNCYILEKIFEIT